MSGALKEKNVIERVGSYRNGYWKTAYSAYELLARRSKTAARNQVRWLDGWLDESGWCAQPPQISTLSERAYEFEPRTLHHLNRWNSNGFRVFLGSWIWLDGNSYARHPQSVEIAALYFKGLLKLTI